MKTLAAQPWPGLAPAPQDGLFVILVRTAPQREAARLEVRRAGREALALVLGRTPGEIDIASTPGQPPRIVVAGGACGIGCSFAHDDGCALAAFNLRGAVGVDLMRVQDVPDWQAVARDYLGPAASTVLDATPDAERPRAFAQAWTRREAALKCAGLPLGEWRNDIDSLTMMLAMPSSDLVASIAALPETASCVNVLG